MGPSPEAADPSPLSPFLRLLRLLGTLGSGPGWRCGLAGHSPNKRSHSLICLITVPASHLLGARAPSPGPFVLQFILLIFIIDYGLLLL